MWSPFVFAFGDPDYAAVRLIRTTLLPIKTAKVFKQQIMTSRVVLADEVERTIRRKRTAHLVAISLERLGLYAIQVID